MMPRYSSRRERTRGVDKFGSDLSTKNIAKKRRKEKVWLGEESELVRGGSLSEKAFCGYRGSVQQRARSG